MLSQYMDESVLVNVSAWRLQTHTVLVGSTPSTPRGAIVRATQGGRILAERTIAWVSLDPDIKRLWFNEQVGAPHDPSIEWLR